MTTKKRLGVALLLDRPHADEVDGLRRAVGDRALARIPAHLTLVPPVNVRGADLDTAYGLVRAAAAACAGPLRLTLGPPATFLPANPVLFLPVGGDLAQLRRLRDAAFLPPFERRLAWPWVPHVTVADDLDPVRIEAAVLSLAGYQVVVDVDRVVLLEERHGAPAGVGAAGVGAAGVGVAGPEAPGSGAAGSEAAGFGAGGRRWVPLLDAALAPAVVVGRGGFELTLVAGRVLGPDAVALLVEVGGGPESADSIWGAGAGGDGVGASAFAGSGLGATIVLSGLVAGDLVGVARAWRGDDGGHIGVVVAPGHRRSGIGRHLLAHAEAAVRRAGWNCPSLQAIGPGAFYSACGNFSVVG